MIDVEGHMGVGGDGTAQTLYTCSNQVIAHFGGRVNLAKLIWSPYPPSLILIRPS